MAFWRYHALHLETYAVPIQALCILSRIKVSKSTIATTEYYATSITLAVGSLMYTMLRECHFSLRMLAVDATIS